MTDLLAAMKSATPDEIKSFAKNLKIEVKDGKWSEVAESVEAIRVQLQESDASNDTEVETQKVKLQESAVVLKGAGIADLKDDGWQVRVHASLNESEKSEFVTLMHPEMVSSGAGLIPDVSVKGKDLTESDREDLKKFTN